MKERIFSLTPQDKTIREDHFRSGGKGGQNQNKRDTGVRFTHLPSGAVGESREERSQLANRKIAWKRMAESSRFKVWLKMELGLRSEIEAKVKEEMKNIKIETRENGKWEAEK